MDEALNSHLALVAAATALGLTDCLLGGGVPDDEPVLRVLVMRWVGQDKAIMTNLWTSFASRMLTAGGSELLAHIKTGFIDAMVEGSGAAEQQLRDFLWPSIFAGDAIQAQTQLQMLWSIVARVPTSVAGNTQYWIGRVTDEMPNELSTELQRYLDSKSAETRLAARGHSMAFAKALGAALNAQARRAKSSSAAGMQMNPTFVDPKGSTGSGARRAVEGQQGRWR